jgi:uncharacterized protein
MNHWSIMPVQLSYPGVYIEEVASGVRTIVGVATSTTAFVGAAPRGPVDDPITVTGFGEYQRVFGGLWHGSRLGFAVRDFFLNGGGTAVIVRVFHPSDVDAGGAPTEYNAFSRIVWATDDDPTETDALIVTAAQPGLWGAKLRIRVDYETRDQSDLGLFNLIVFDGSTGAIETHRNLSVRSADPRFAPRAIEQDSLLVRVAVGGDRPLEHRPNPAPGTSIWAPQPAPAAADPDQRRETSIGTLTLVPPLSDGGPLEDADFTDGDVAGKRGLYALENADLFNLLVIPPPEGGDLSTALVAAAATYCERRRAILLTEPLLAWDTVGEVATGFATGFSSTIGTASKNAALSFPHLRQPNPLMDNQVETFSPGGAVAGTIARTDAQRGVWKAPAGLDATLNGVPQLSVPLTDADIGRLNPLGVNCLRALPGVGSVVWGARTMQGADRLASEWKYLPVRRTALYIEESLFRGTQWVVFEPNDEPLWAQIRLNVGSFMNNLFRQGAFQGTTPKEAYFVKCDRDTTTQADIDLGIVNIHVGFAPLKPAEFVVIRLQQMSGLSAA